MQNKTKKVTKKSIIVKILLIVAVLGVISLFVPKPVNKYFYKSILGVYLEKNCRETFEFFCLKKVSEIDPLTFSAPKGDSLLARDKNNIYILVCDGSCWTEVLKEADPDSYVFLGGHYSKDKNNAYFKASILDANPETFTRIDGWYAKDDISVFRGSTKLETSDPESFIKLSDVFAKDKSNVYKLDELVVGADATTFEIIQDEYARDINHVYYWDNVVQGADPETFELLPYKLGNPKLNSPIYGKDKDSVFYRAEVIHGADPNNFVVDSSGYNWAYSDWKVYLDGKPTELVKDELEVIDPDTILINGEEYRVRWRTGEDELVLKKR
jgi:hypothetical protein